MKRVYWIIFAVISSLLLVLFCASLVINARVKSFERDILSPEQAYALEDVDCILILGCGVRADGSPSDMLLDRVSCGVAAYKSGAAPKILMSGDHGQTDYDEVNVMKNLAIDAGVPSEDIFMDHAGFSTYDSLYRVWKVFGARKILIVSQEYHLPRALYLAHCFGLEAYGISADPREYAGQFQRDIREYLARNKDFITSIIKPAPKYTGKPISLEGDGNVTNG